MLDDITVHLTSSLTSSDRRLSQEWTLEYFKNRIEQITGIPAKSQKIWIYKTADSNERTELADSLDVKTTTLEDLKIPAFTRIHVDSTEVDPDMEQLQKDLLEGDGAGTEYKLDEKRYDELMNTVKKWKQEHKLGRFDPAFVEQKKRLYEEIQKRSRGIKVGDRCRLTNAPMKRIGTVRYIGDIPEIKTAAEVWVGVELDGPFGKNDGSIKGKRYFTCERGHGSFVSPLSVEVGDFSEDSASGSDDDDDDDL